MSYGHADKIARLAASTPAASSEKPAPTIDPALYHRDDVRPVLATRNIAGLFRVLKNDVGLTQRTIAELVGMSQSEVSEILDGRRVLSYDVLVRIAEGLGVPRERMGLSYGERGAYGGEVTAPEPPEEVDEMTQRRDVLAVGALATLGFVPSFAALLDSSATPADVPLPSRLGASDVAEIRNTTEQLRAAARLQGGGRARATSATAAHYRRLTAVPGGGKRRGSTPSCGHLRRNPPGDDSCAGRGAGRARYG